MRTPEKYRFWDARSKKYAGLVAIVLLCFMCGGMPGRAQPACDAGARVFVGPRLASFDSSRGALSNALFTALLGSQVELSVLDWNALADADISLAGYLEVLALELGVSSPDEVLTSGATVLQLVTAAATLAEADGDTALVAALRAMRLSVSGLSGTVSLSNLLDLSIPTGALADARLNALSPVTGLVQLYNQYNVLAAPQPVSLSASVLGTLGMGGI